MSTVHEESRLRFVFGDAWSLVIKWDDHSSFKNGLCKFGETKGIDFLGVLLGEPKFIEVKNFCGYRIQNKRRLSSGELVREVGAKVRDSIASLVWVQGRAHLHASDVEQFIQTMFGWKGKVSVVLWLEDDQPLTPAEASQMENQLRRELRWLNPKVVVTCRALVERQPLPELAVSGLPDAGIAPVTG